MSLYTYANNVRATLKASLTNSATTLTLDQPVPPFNPPPVPAAGRTGLLTLTQHPVFSATDIEIVAYTGVTTNADGSTTLTGLTRGYDGTAARAWGIGDIAYQAVTAGAMNDLGTASQADTGTGQDNVPTTADADARYLLRTGNLAGLNNTASARQNLGLGALAALNTVNNSLFSGSLAIAKGGTGATSAAAARDKLGLSAVAASGAYDDLSGAPLLATVATSGRYGDLANTPALKPVATSGSYNDLLNAPTLGTAASKDVGFFASAAQGVRADNAIPSSLKAANNGVATLTAAGQIPLAQIPQAIRDGNTYQGSWNASAGTAPSTSPTKGQYWIVATSGATNLSGITDWKAKDWAVYDGSEWAKVDNTDNVASVAGITGVISSSGLRHALGVNLVDNTADADKPVSTAQQAALNTKLDKTANAVSATELKTARTIALGGLLGGAASFNGSGDVTITATMADGALSIAKIAGLGTALAGKATAAQGDAADTAVQPNTSATLKNTLNIDSDPGEYAIAYFQRSGGNRWSLFADNDATANFKIFRYDDSGVYVGYAMYIDRVSADVHFYGTLQTSRFRATDTADCSLTSTDHGFQIGDSGGSNLRMGGNEIMAVNNGATSNLYLQNDGGAVSCGGDLSADSVTDRSDARYKFDVSPMSSGTKLDALRPVWFWNKRTKRQDFGLIAQEVREVYPEIVHEDDNGYLSLGYQRLVAPLIAEVQSLRKRVAELEAKP